MGGSGGSDYRDSLGGTGARGSDGPSCATLAFEAAVMSPDPQVVEQIEIGTMCEILLEGTPRQIVVFVRSTGARLGAIMDRWDDLTGCIDSGFAYEAEVISIVPVRVQIRRRRPYLLALPCQATVVGITQDLLNPAEGDQIDLALTDDGRAVALSTETEILGCIPAEPVALPEAIGQHRARTATLDAYEADGSLAHITITEV